MSRIRHNSLQLAKDENRERRVYLFEVMQARMPYAEAPDILSLEAPQAKLSFSQMETAELARAHLHQAVEAA